MRNFAIHFTHPWLLLLLIPAFALTIALYFTVNKRFRRTRNRIVSIICHSLVMVLCIFVLAGIGFTYDVTNLENEIILLVDVSDTEERSAQRRDEFLETVISESGYDGYKVGIVTFGFDQHYAVPLTYDTDSIFGLYQQAEENGDMPDTSATNIAAALRFVLEQKLFTKPETAKIVLISDGKETDEEALTVIGTIAKQGIIVDTVCISSEFTEDNVQVVGVTYPEYHINPGEEFDLSIDLQCKTAAPSTTVQVYDNGELKEEMSRTVDLAAGNQSVVFKTVFPEVGLHEISVKMTSGSDRLESNNSFASYYFLEVFNRVLIIEHKSGESEALKAMLAENEAQIYADSVDVLDLSTAEYDDIPHSVDELRAYDQIILNNIANADLKDLERPADMEESEAKDWFVKMLDSYVSDYGGGLLTVGGREEVAVDGGNPVLGAHAYNRTDLYNTRLQEMLPVQVIDYTPPVAVMIIIDISASMGSDSEGSPLYYAKQGAISCLEVLTERDYVGIMTLDSNYGVALPLTPTTEIERIRNAIMGLGEGGSTVYSDAIKTAGERLRQLQNVDKRHIVMVTDGDPGEEPEDYVPIAEDLYKSYGITLSMIGIGISEGDTNFTEMTQLVTAAGGQLFAADDREIIEKMRADLNAPTIKEFDDEKAFNPIVNDVRSALFNNVTYGETTENRRAMDVKLGGFFGVKKRESAEVPLVGDYDVPIYAQWKRGKGTVGSFLCDLDGSNISWSKDFMADENGRQFLYNVIANLMPTEDLHPGEITLELSEENYINRLSVFTPLEEGQYIEGTIREASAEEDAPSYSLSYAPEEQDGQLYITEFLTELNRYSRSGFVVKRSGTYRITVQKFAEDGTLLASAEIYKSFSYSQEYDSFIENKDPETGKAMLDRMAEYGGGISVAEDDPWSVFDSFITSLHRSYDPRLALILIAMILFLGDIAVRKFKFKWIHELVREHRAKKEDKK